MYDKGFKNTLKVVKNFDEENVDESVGKMVPHFVNQNKTMDSIKLKKTIQRHVKKVSGVSTYHDGDDLVHKETGKTIMSGSSNSKKSIEDIAQHVKKSFKN